MCEGLLTGAETKAHPREGDSSQSWGPGAHCPDCRQLKVERVLSKCPAEKNPAARLSLLCGFACLRVFFEVWLPFSERGSQLWHKSGQVQGLPEATLSCLPPCLKSVPTGCHVSVLEETVHNRAYWSMSNVLQES